MASSGRKGGGMIGEKLAIPEEHAFATPGEIHSRDHTAHEESPTTFVQMGPGDQPGVDMAHMDEHGMDRSGAFKFSGGV